MNETEANNNSTPSQDGDASRYLVVMPCRNEEDHVGRTIETMIAQTLLPALWIIVDDGSSDRTPEILKKAAEEHDFIKIVRREDRGRRRVGPGVIETFNAGIETVNLDDFDFVCKLDADLELPSGYFEHVVAEMNRDPHLGNFSGKLFHRLENGKLEREPTGDENAIGPAKFYRVACYKDIGGFIREVMWDGIDGHMCRMKGWIARSEDRPEIRITHRRLMGSSEVGIWTGRKRWGFGKYFMGSSLLYMIAVSAYRMCYRPFVIGGIGIFWGYCAAMLTRKKRFDGPGFRPYMRAFEMRSLLKGKRSTAEWYHDQIRQSKAVPGNGGRE